MNDPLNIPRARVVKGADRTQTDELRDDIHRMLKTHPPRTPLTPDQRLHLTICLMICLTIITTILGSIRIIRG